MPTLRSLRAPALPFRSVLAAICAVALAVRLAFVLVVQSRITELSGDAGWYHFQARLVAEGRGFLNPVFFFDSGLEVPGADHPPGFVVLLAGLDLLGVSTPQGQRVAMTLVGTASVAVIGLLGRRVASERVGLVAAAVAALYPNLWINDGMLLTETVMVLMSAVALLFTYRYLTSPSLRELSVVAVALSVATSVRPESALLFAVLVLPLVLSRRTLPWRDRLIQLAAAAAMPLVVLGPWVAYNLARFEEPVLLSSGAGQTLLAGNCDTTYSGPLIGFWDFECLGEPEAPPTEGGDLSHLDARYREQALDYMAGHLDEVPEVVAVRVLRVWGLFRPEQTIFLDGTLEGRAGGEPGQSLWIAREAQWSYYVLAAAALVGLVILRRRRVQVLPLLAQALVVTVVAAATFGLTRYRAGFEVSIVVLAAVALGQLVTVLTGVEDRPVIGPLGDRPGPDRPGAPATGAAAADDDTAQGPGGDGARGGDPVSTGVGT